MSCTIIAPHNTKKTIFGIPVNRRGAICRSRDYIKSSHNVNIYFPRNGICGGGYQEMHVVGTKMNVDKAKAAIDIILENAEQDYQEYLARKHKRTNFTRKFSYESVLPSVSTPQKSVNMFDSLEIDPKTTVKPVKPVEFPALSAKTKKSKKVSWGPHLNKKPNKQHVPDIVPDIVPDTVSKPIVLEKESLGNWGDESDEE